MIRAIRSQKGFTLMEAVLAVGLLALVSVVSLSIVVNVLRSATKSQAATDVEQAASFVLSNLEDDVKKSTSAFMHDNDLNLTGPSFAAIYNLGVCDCNLNCVKVSRDGGASWIKLTDDKGYGLPCKPAQTSVTLELGGTSYFTVISSAGTPLAVNVKIKFLKPNPTGPGMFRAETTLDTTIELGGASR